MLNRRLHVRIGGYISNRCPYFSSTIIFSRTFYFRQIILASFSQSIYHLFIQKSGINALDR